MLIHLYEQDGSLPDSRVQCAIKGRLAFGFHYCATHHAVSLIPSSKRMNFYPLQRTFIPISCTRETCSKWQCIIHETLAAAPIPSPRSPSFRRMNDSYRDYEVGRISTPNRVKSDGLNSSQPAHKMVLSSILERDFLRVWFGSSFWSRAQVHPTNGHRLTRKHGSWRSFAAPPRWRLS